MGKQGVMGLMGSASVLGVSAPGAAGVGVGSVETGTCGTASAVLGLSALLFGVEPLMPLKVAFEQALKLITRPNMSHE